MNKTELIEVIAEKVGVAKAEAERMINTLEEIITSTLKAGGEVVITGFGTFSAKKRGARTGRNPRTGESVNIPAMNVPKFKAGKTLKDALK